jgi:hypothetical protein
MKPQWSDSLRHSILHCFLKGDSLKLIVASHSPLDSSQSFLIIQFEIIKHMAFETEQQVAKSSDCPGLILDPVHLRQVALRHSHLLSFEVFDALFGVKSLEELSRVVAEGIRQFTAFEPMHLSEWCRFVFELVPARAVITEEHARAGLLAEELEESWDRVRDEKQYIEDLQMANEDLQRRLAEEHLHGDEVCLERLERELDDLTRRFEDEKAVLQSRSRAVQARLKRQIGVLKKSNDKDNFEPMCKMEGFSAN